MDDPLSIKLHPTHECGLHGKTHHVIVSNIPGAEGAWCMLCVVDHLNETLPHPIKEIDNGTH